MKRVKKPKKRQLPTEYVFKASMNVIMSAVVVSLSTVYGWDKKKLEELVESIRALIDEQDRKSMTTNDMVNWAKEVADVDVRLWD